MSNKLYTEEQVRRAIDIIDDSHHQLEYYEVLEKLTPIELPSDEEIEAEAGRYAFIGGCDISFKGGVQWMRDKIHGGEQWRIF